MSARAGSALAAAPYTLGFLLLPITWWSAQQGGVWLWLPVLVLYVGFPLVDALTSLNPLSPAPDQVTALERNVWFRLVTWLWVPAHVWLVVWALTVSLELSGWAWAGLTMSVGSIAGGIGITFAHELVHRPGRFERVLGDVLLALVTYPHFAVEHVYGHHRHVATPLDPATARLGESFYRFWPRTVFGGFRHALRLEPRLVARYAVTTPVVYTAVWWRWGGDGLLFFAAQGIVAFTLLEAINYVEHYGLVRREVEPGRYERVSPAHSWDSAHRVSNWLLINLARHADHHLIASRRYQALASQAQAPQLPAGYGTMLLMAFVPPLWRRVMDPRVRAARGQ
jgi:alkane 1-monooxygenase